MKKIIKDLLGITAIENHLVRQHKPKVSIGDTVYDTRSALFWSQMHGNQRGLVVSGVGKSYWDGLKPVTDIVVTYSDGSYEVLQDSMVVLANQEGETK